MTLTRLIHIMQKFNQLGSGVQDQFYDICGDGDMEEQNPNALKEIRKFLNYCAEKKVDGAAELSERITEFFEE